MYSIRTTVRVTAIQLNVDNMEIVEALCKGRIRGIRLEPKDRIVQFDNLWTGGEEEIQVGNWLVQFDNGHDLISQVWPDTTFKNFFEKVST